MNISPKKRKRKIQPNIAKQNIPWGGCGYLKGGVCSVTRIRWDLVAYTVYNGSSLQFPLCMPLSPHPTVHHLTLIWPFLSLLSHPCPLCLCPSLSVPLSTDGVVHCCDPSTLEPRARRNKGSLGYAARKGSAWTKQEDWKQEDQKFNSVMEYLPSICRGNMYHMQYCDMVHQKGNCHQAGSKTQVHFTGPTEFKERTISWKLPWAPHMQAHTPTMNKQTNNTIKDTTKTKLKNF